ncbi:MAG: hypothetical protein K0S44_1948 [Bacteroidetes bacterium]|jgi:hypothetical protein|nr:hypothetical protein [Bacteroidota bacterium]
MKNTLTLNAKIKAPKENLYPYFLDFQKFGDLHPLITKVTKTGINKFHIYESVLLLGFIPMKPNYPVEVTEENGAIIYNSNVKKGVDLHIKITFEEDLHTGLTTITETVNVKAMRLVAIILLNTMKKAHSQLFDKLKNQFH